jgi:hypothetical protein
MLEPGQLFKFERCTITYNVGGKYVPIDKGEFAIVLRRNDNYDSFCYFLTRHGVCRCFTTHICVSTADEVPS